MAITTIAIDTEIYRINLSTINVCLCYKNSQKFAKHVADYGFLTNFAHEL